MVQTYSYISQSQSTGAAGGYQPVAPKKKKRGGPPPPPRVSQLTPTEQQKLKETGTTGVRAPQIPVGFTGKVAESFQGQPQQEKFYVKGKEVGRIVTPVGEKPRAVTTRPSQFVFRRPSGETQEVTFRESGGEVIERTQVQVPSLFGEGPILATPERVAQLKEEKRLGKKETQQVRREEITARQQLPVFERIGYAYKGGELEKPFEVDIRGGIRVGLELSQIGFEKVVGAKPEKLGFLGIPVSSRIPEDIIISAGLLGPTTATTAQIERQLFEVSRVKIAGVTQTVGKGKVTTQAGFTVARAGKTIKGIVQAESIPQQQIVISAAKGKTFVRGVEFPTGKEVIKSGKLFKTVELAKVTEKEGLYFTKAFGRAKTGAEQLPYRSAGVSMQRGEYLIQAGVTATPKGTAFSTGVLKIKTGVPRSTFRVTGISGTRANINQIMGSSETTLRSVSLAATKSAVRASVQIPPKPITQIFPVVSARTFTTTTQELQTVMQPVTTKQVTIPAQKITQVAAPAQRVRQRGRQRFVQRQVVAQIPAQAAIQKTLLMTKQIGLQRTLQRQTTITRTISLQRTVQRAVPFTIKIPLPKIPKEPVPLFAPPRKAKAMPTGPSKYPVLMRRFGKFRIVGYGRTPMEAVQIGKKATRTTLGATFKVPGAKLTEIPGYRTKKTKKEGLVFIQKRKYRLAAPTEIKEIQFFKRVKGDRKKK